MKGEIRKICPYCKKENIWYKMGLLCPCTKKPVVVSTKDKNTEYELSMFKPYLYELRESCRSGYNGYIKEFPGSETDEKCRLSWRKSLLESEGKYENPIAEDEVEITKDESVEKR